jgi:hypothetical protein
MLAHSLKLQALPTCQYSIWSYEYFIFALRLPILFPAQHTAKVYLSIDMGIILA